MRGNYNPTVFPYTNHPRPTLRSITTTFDFFEFSFSQHNFTLFWNMPRLAW